MRTSRTLVPACLAILGLVTTVSLAAAGEQASRPEGREEAAAAWSKQTIFESAHGLGHVAVADDPSTGVAAIGWFDFVETNLFGARYLGPGGDCGPGMSWSCGEIVGIAGDNGRYLSVASWQDSSDTYFFVPFFGATAGNLAYFWIHLDTETVYSLLDDGIDGIEGETGKYTSAAIDTAGNPHVAYQNETGPGTVGVHYMYAHRIGGGGGNCGVGDNWECIEVEFKTAFGSEGASSLALAADDTPWIAFYDWLHGYPLVTTYHGPGGNCGPSYTWSCRPANRAGKNTGVSVALILDLESVPHLAYQNVTDGTLEHARWVGSGGNCGFSIASQEWEWRCDVIATMGPWTATRTVAMAADPQGRPVIAFRDATEDLAPTLLKVARPLAAMAPGTSGNCGPDATWYCETIDGGVHREEADTLGIAVDDKGWAYIAYHEYDDYSLLHRIRLASVFLGVFGDGFESHDTSAWSDATP